MISNSIKLTFGCRTEDLSTTKFGKPAWTKFSWKRSSSCKQLNSQHLITGVWRNQQASRRPNDSGSWKLTSPMAKNAHVCINFHWPADSWTLAIMALLSLLAFGVWMLTIGILVSNTNEGHEHTCPLFWLLHQPLFYWKHKPLTSTRWRNTVLRKLDTSFAFPLGIGFLDRRVICLTIIDLIRGLVCLKLARDEKELPKNLANAFNSASKGLMMSFKLLPSYVLSCLQPHLTICHDDLLQPYSPKTRELVFGYQRKHSRNSSGNLIDMKHMPTMWYASARRCIAIRTFRSRVTSVMISFCFFASFMVPSGMQKNGRLMFMIYDAWSQTLSKIIPSNGMKRSVLSLCLLYGTIN